MRAAIYNPYLDTIGGGERYSMAVAEVLIKAGYEVDVQWRTGTIKGKLEERFGIDLGQVNFVPDVKRGDGYDVCFWVSDGSIPVLRARKNFLHFQFPFQNVGGNTLLNKMKLFRVNKIICNSNFTKKFIDEEYGVNSLVVYPPVDVDKIKPKKKENTIIFVGRFSQLTQAKNQHILVSTFKSFFDKQGEDWKLLLMGGVEVGVGGYIKRLRRLAVGYPIEIHESPTFTELKEAYGKAKIFWSAVGFGIEEAREPKKVEHFGITVVEAMAAGVVPIVYSAGGYKEIVEDGKNGFLWSTKGKLLKYTKILAEDKVLAKELSGTAVKDAQKFSYDRFEKKFLELL